MSRRPVLIAATLALALVALEALLLRGLLHPAPHPGGDNAAYVTLAASLVSGQGYTELWDPARLPHAKYPPVFPVLLAARIATGGVSWAALKLVTALTGLLAVLATFLWARERAGLALGAGVALLTAMSAAVLDYGRWILSDVPFVAFTLLALWAVERADPRGRAEAERRGEGPEEGSGAGPVTGMGDAGAAADVPTAGAAGWWAAAFVFTGLAYFTRSAGLPLLLALVAVLALRRRWRALVLGGGALGLAALAWLLRGRAVAPTVADYADAFWLLDPYDPALGFAGPADLLARMAGNVGGYLTVHMPLGLTGSAAGAGLVVGAGVTLLGLAGWILRLRRPGVPELFLPLYGGLVLVWPEVWSGDRFALPLIPLLLLYAGLALRAGVERAGRPAAVAGVLAAAGGVTLLVQIPGYQRLAGEAAACRGVTEAVGPYACAGSPFFEFAEAARWAGANLPADAAVLTRKPRLWYALSGRPSRTYPFEPDSDVLLETADQAGARWVVFDFIGNQGVEFLAPAITSRPAAFCSVGGFGGEEGRPATQLLGILPPEQRTGAGIDEEGRISIAACPPDLARGMEEVEPYSASSPIPILAPSPP